MPQATVAPAWTESANPEVVATRQNDRDWWNVFADATLDRLVQTAYDQNLTLQAAGLRVLQERAQLGVAIGEFYPQKQTLSAGAAYSANSSSAQIGSNAISGSSNSSFWQAGIGPQVGWEIDIWGKIRRGIEAADAAYLQSVATYDDVLVTLLADVASNYVAIRTLQTQIAIAKENVAKQEKSLAIAEARFKGGATSKRDVYQAENVLGQTRAAIPQLTGQLQQSKDALAVLLGTTPDKIDAMLGGPQVIPVAPATVAVGAPADLLRRRPDIRRAELAAVAASAQIGITKAELYPTFSLTGSLGLFTSNLNTAALGSAYAANGLSYSFGPVLQWNILNYGQITNKVRAQDARFQASIADYQNTVLKAQQQVEDGLATFLQSRQQAAFLQQSVKAAEGALTIAVLQYQQGALDFTTVLTAEQNLYQAQTNLATAQGNVAVGLITTYRGMGGGWQLREGQPFVPQAIRDTMERRTDWGSPNQGLLTPSAPALPSSDDVSSKVRAPDW